MEVMRLEYSRTRKGFNYNPRFLEFIELFAKIGADSRIFPKKCGTCGALVQKLSRLHTFYGTSSPRTSGLL